LESARNLLRGGLLNRWLQLYYQGLGDQDFTIEGLRTFIENKIRESDEDNNPDTWRDVIDTFVNSDGVRMFTGGVRKYPRRINVSFGKKSRKSLKQMVKTKRLRKYKKKMTRHIKKSRQRLSRKLLKSSNL
jgi:hypothetical protein